MHTFVIPRFLRYMTPADALSGFCLGPMDGYVHRLVTHGAPIERVTIGAGCQEDELEGLDLTAKAAQHSASRRARLTTDDNADTQRRKKPRMGTGHGPDARAHVSPHPPPPQQQQQHPGTRHGGRGRGGGLRRTSGAGGGGITASLFEREDWEADPLWAAMEEAVAGGVVGSLVEAGLENTYSNAHRTCPYELSSEWILIPMYATRFVVEYSRPSYERLRACTIE